MAAVAAFRRRQRSLTIACNVLSCPCTCCESLPPGDSAGTEAARRIGCRGCDGATPTRATRRPRWLRPGRLGHAKPTDSARSRRTMPSPRFAAGPAKGQASRGRALRACATRPRPVQVHAAPAPTPHTSSPLDKFAVPWQSGVRGQGFGTRKDWGLEIMATDSIFVSRVISL